MVGVAALALLLTAAPAGAASAKDDADAAIARGVALRRQGEDARALEEFQRAKAAWPSPRASAQVGLALQALGRWAEAESEIEAAIHEEQDPWILKNRSTLEGALDVIRQHVGRLEILGSPEGAEIFVEQRRVGVLPLRQPVRVTAGTVGLEVRAVGYLPVTRNISIAAGMLSRETVKLTPDPAAIAPPPGDPRTSEAESESSRERPSTSSHDWHLPAAWTVGAGGVVLLAGGVTALFVRSSRSDQLSGKLSDHSCMQSGNSFSGPGASSCVDLATSRDRWTGIAIGTLAGAVVAGTITVALAATRAPAVSGSAHAAVRETPQVNAAIDSRLGMMLVSWAF